MNQKTQISKMMAALRREKQALVKRVYPKYSPGMTAGEYVRRFNALNVGTYQSRITLDFDPDSLTSESSMYDPLTPLVVEEIEQ